MVINYGEYPEDVKKTGQNRKGTDKYDTNDSFINNAFITSPGTQSHLNFSVQNIIANVRG